MLSSSKPENKHPPVWQAGSASPPMKEVLGRDGTSCLGETEKQRNEKIERRGEAGVELPLPKRANWKLGPTYLMAEMQLHSAYEPSA